MLFPYSRLWHLLLLAPILLAPILIVSNYIGIADFSIVAHAKLGLFSESVENSLIHLVFTLLGCVVISIPLAWLTAMCRFAGRDIFQWVLLIPLAMPTFSIAVIYEQSQLFEMLPLAIRMAIYSTFSLYPLVYLVMRLAFVSQNAEYLDASRCLGWGIFASMIRMGMSMNRPILVAALLLVAMEVVSDIATAQLLGFQSIANSIYEASTQSGFTSLALELSIVLVSLFLVIFWFENFTRGNRRYHQIVSGFRRAEPVDLNRNTSLVSFFLCMGVIFFAVILPFFMLVSASPNIEQTPLPELFVPAITSFSVAAITAAIVIVFAFLVSFALRYTQSNTLLLVHWLTGLTLVIPSSILAFMVITPVDIVDEFIEQFFAAMSIPVVAPLKSSFVPLIYVLVLKFLAIGSFVIRAAILATSDTMDMASRSLGHSARNTFFKVHLPLLMPTMCAVFFLVFSETIQEGAITILLTPQEHFTLVSYAITNIGIDGIVASSRELILITTIALVPALIMTATLKLIER